MVRKPGAQEPWKQRVFVVVSRQALLDSRFSTVICAPVYSRHDGLSTQVRAGSGEGLKQESSIHCDGLISLPKTMLTHVGSLRTAALEQLNAALTISLGLEIGNREVRS